MSAKRPLNIAHRGGMGIWPENTLFAFENAIKRGADVLELDVWPSSDGHIMVIHDETVDRTSNGKGKVGELTLAELRSLDFGYRFQASDGTFPYRNKGITIPDLESLFQLVPDAYFNIDIKLLSTDFADDVVEMVRLRGMTEKTVLASFHDPVMVHLRAVAPEIRTAASQNEVKWLYFWNLLGLGWLHKPVAETLQVPVTHNGLTVVTPRFVKTAHALGQEVYVWDISDQDEIKMLIEMGVDGFITDRPDQFDERFR